MAVSPFAEQIAGKLHRQAQEQHKFGNPRRSSYVTKSGKLHFRITSEGEVRPAAGFNQPTSRESYPITDTSPKSAGPFMGL